MAKSTPSFGGPILIIGGAEDKFNERHIIRKFVSLSGDKKANILIIPIASDFAEIASNLSTTIFSILGFKVYLKLIKKIFVIILKSWMKGKSKITINIF